MVAFVVAAVVDNVVPVDPKHLPLKSGQNQATFSNSDRLVDGGSVKSYSCHVMIGYVST